MRSTIWMCAAAAAVVGAPAVSPAWAVPMTNLELWVRADVGVEEASGDAAEDGDDVPIWRDQSGNNRHLNVGPNTTFVSPIAPGFDADAANGAPAVVFNQPNEQLQ